MSYFDVAGDTPERVYHAFVLGMLTTLEGRYRVCSNRESGYGRYDVMLEPLDAQDPGVVIEFKRAQGNVSLEEVAVEALDQIQSMRYETALVAQGVRCVHCWGMAFRGKAAVACVQTHR